MTRQQQQQLFFSVNMCLMLTMVLLVQMHRDHNVVHAFHPTTTTIVRNQQQHQQQRRISITYSADTNAVVSTLRSMLHSSVDDEADVDNEDDMLFPPAVTPIEAPPAKKRASPKRKATKTAAVDAAVEASVTPATTAPSKALPTRIYYQAKEDDEVYSVSYVTIDPSKMELLKDLKALLRDVNEWTEDSSRRIIFYTNDTHERIPYSTPLEDCILNNSKEYPLLVSIVSSTASAPTLSNNVGEQADLVLTEVNNIGTTSSGIPTNNNLRLYETPTSFPVLATTTTPEIAPVTTNDESRIMTATAATSSDLNESLVRNIIAPQPQAPFMPGPKTGRGAVVDMYSDLPTSQQQAQQQAQQQQQGMTNEWANRLPVGNVNSQQQSPNQQPYGYQQSSAIVNNNYPPPPPRPSMEETGRFWMNKISLDLGVVLVAKVMKALESSQFLVLAAPGGYGKTSLLQLLERVYEKQGKCVVRFRILQDTDVYHQFQTSSGIDLKNAYIHDLRPNYQKVILIDDAHKVNDTPGFWEILLKKFPTWCFAWDYTIIFAVTLPVSAGSPIVELLGDPSIPHLGPKDFVPDEQ